MKKLAKKKKSPSEVRPTEVNSIEKPKYANLQEVMDYTKPLSIFFSGVEYESYLDILYGLGIRNFLMSYEYLKGKGSSVFKKYSDIRLFIDSGAFTYQSDPKYAEYTVEQWESQIQTYLSWVERHKDYIFAIADLDLQYLPKVGYETVYKWREKYFEPFMLRTGIPVCFIYHEDGLDKWEYMCKRYPYVGMSLIMDNPTGDDSILREMFRIAEKHNTLIQGMASTNTRMLTDYPFYTVDSTTWNVGLKYGEISVWTGTKMSRIKKADFQNKAFPLISKYDTPFDFNLILEEDKTEMIRVNAYAFIQAEKYIHTRLKSRMYWLKAKAKKIDIDNLPEDFFPTPEWFDGEGEDTTREYAEKMNINPDYEGVSDVLFDMTMFNNWNNPVYAEKVATYTPEIIKGLHDSFINRIVPDDETRVNDLINFFRECLSGKNDTLLQLGTNFDRSVKERESYIEEEEEYDYVDVDPETVRAKVHNLLPDFSSESSQAPELDELDEEIYKKAEIIPTFDERGKFVKGQVAVRKPKRLYSKKFPKLACDTCYCASKCSEYKSGYACAYNKMFDRFDTRDMNDIIQAMQGMVDHNLARMQKAMIMETIMGTQDPNVTQLINQNMALLNNLKQMYENGSPEVLRQTKIMRSDGSTEITTQVTNPQSGGVLEKIFGNIGNKNNDDPSEE